MTRLSAFVIGAVIALSTIALAGSEPPLAGVWKLSMGKAACTLTLANDPAFDHSGVARPSAKCASGLHAISRWQETPAGLELLAPCGRIVAWLEDIGGAFVGPRFADGKPLALDR